MDTLTLLPDPRRFRLEYIACSADMLTITLSSVPTRASCPVCQNSSERRHSRYQRPLADLPWNRGAVRIQRRARKFDGDNADCERVRFTEPLPDLAAR
jgi:transposase